MNCELFEIAKKSPNYKDYVISNGLLNNQLNNITLPSYTSTAFGLFFNIPGYDSVLIKNLKETIQSNNNKQDFYPVLSKIPFIALTQLFCENKFKKPSDLTHLILKNGILKFCLSLLSTLSHNEHRIKKYHFIQTIPPPPVQKINKLSSSHGIGFGTGSTAQQWDSKKTLIQQNNEENDVILILEILSSYIEWFELSSNIICDVTIEMLDHSCLMNTLSCYLRNGSVLDMSRHIPLYTATLNLTKNIISNHKLKTILVEYNIYELISNMKDVIDRYIRRLR
jgi:hypothetical protein